MGPASLSFVCAIAPDIPEFSRLVSVGGMGRSYFANRLGLDQHLASSKQI